jgi:hypothetical protein
MRRALLLTALALLAGGVAPACLHPPRDYKGTIVSTTQEALIFWRDGREELVLKVNFAIHGGPQMEQGALPANLGWVIPVPNAPDAYAVADPAIFEDAFHLAELYTAKPRSDGQKGPPPNSVDVGQKISVGEYDIVPVKATGPDAAAALNDWLVKEDFSRYPLENMRYYTERKWTFLAVKVNKDKAAASLATRGGLRPLRISFAADKIYYPLKFSSSSGEFGVRAYVFTERPLADPGALRDRKLTAQTTAGKGLGSAVVRPDDLRFNKGHWQSMAMARVGVDEATRKAAEERLALIDKGDAKAETALYKMVREMEKGKLGAFKTLHVCLFVGRVNGDGNKLGDWKTDFELEAEKP